ncbi:MAG: hydrogenase iron-sulfur subunit [bacterium]|nr:hydrogenase iron-sulfur subunit [bacterium]
MPASEHGDEDRDLRGENATPPNTELVFPEPRPRASRWLERALRPLDGLFNRVYTSDWNPLYKSGALAVTFLLMTLVTGVYLFILYQVADPYGSVARLDSTWLGSVMRSVHRYSADLAIVAVALHALKMLMTGRTWGPRALAWVTGVFLLGVLLLCGWTGLVMAWDVQGQLVAIEGARLLDLLPIFSEPISRSFTHPDSVGRSFFFMNLFLHVALPLGLAGLYWLHSSRVARAPIFPPKAIHRYSIGAVIVLSVLVPVPLPPKSDLLAVPIDVPLDVFYAFWLPVARGVSAPAHLLFWAALAAVTVSVPWWWRPEKRMVAKSIVDEHHCAGCTQCYLDCPYEAINMVTRSEPSDLSVYVARVDPALCVGCGICSGSCAPMGVGPVGRSGRDQLRAAEAFLHATQPGVDDLVLIGCGYGPGSDMTLASEDGLIAYPSGCTGSVHTSVIESILRWGVAGVYLLTCPDRDCFFREGPKWLEERVYNDREAELKNRIDKRRVRIGSFATSETALAWRSIAEFRAELAGLSPVVPERDAAVEAECKTTDAYADYA